MANELKKKKSSCSQPSSQQGENQQEVFLLTKSYFPMTYETLARVSLRSVP